MNDGQINTLRQKVKQIKKAEWDIDVPRYKVRNKEWLKSQVSRAFFKLFSRLRKLYMDEL